ncbi:MAG: hypothetical protein ACFFD2_04255 [Promethearchaeota archaeon]
MYDNQDILWEDTEKLMKKHWILLVGFFLGSLAIEIGLFLWNPEDLFNLVIKYIGIGIAGFFVILIFIGFIYEIFRGSCKYYLTTEKLVEEYTTLLGKRKIESFELNNVKTIEINREFGSELNNFLFYGLTIDEIIEEFPVFRDYPKIKEFNSIDMPPDFSFQSVNSPRKLLAVIKSLIPLVKHPDFKNVYIRVE